MSWYDNGELPWQVETPADCAVQLRSCVWLVHGCWTTTRTGWCDSRRCRSAHTFALNHKAHPRAVITWAPLLTHCCTSILHVRNRRVGLLVPRGRPDRAHGRGRRQDQVIWICDLRSPPRPRHRAGARSARGNVRGRIAAPVRGQVACVWGSGAGGGACCIIRAGDSQRSGRVARRALRRP